MKNLFSKPEIEICKLTCNDVVYTSNEFNEIDGGGSGNGGEGGAE